MDKRTVRAFSIGILFTTIILTVWTLFIHQEKQDISLQEAKKILETNGYTVITNKNYAILQSELTSVKEKQNVDNKTKPKTTENQSKQETNKTHVIYILEIKSGMNLSTISDILYKHKIITDNQKFEQFMNDNGYSTKVQIGEFELTSKMSLKEIAETITK